MAQPDPTLPEPDRGVDTIVVYATTSKPTDFEALLQTAIETDPDLIARGREEKVNSNMFSLRWNVLCLMNIHVF